MTVERLSSDTFMEMETMQKFAARSMQTQSQIQTTVFYQRYAHTEILKE